MKLFKKTKERFKNWLKKPIELTEKEVKISKACELILNRPDKLIVPNPNDMSYIIYSDELAYYIHINIYGISFSNHEHSITAPYREAFIDYLKETIITKAIMDREELLATILQNENNILDAMIEELSK